MAIDTKSISQLITEFRALKAKDAITPESLGYILQRLADLIATAGTAETQKIINEWYVLLSKNEHVALCALRQGAADRNSIQLDSTYIDLLTANHMAVAKDIIIQQATTERAGAMRAQQVIDLNNTRRAVADIEKLLDVIQAKLGMTEDSKGLYNTAQISVVTENGRLRLLGAQQLVADGYVPYLFRSTRKRNQWGDKVAIAAGEPRKKYCDKRKGWNLFGSCHTVKITTGNFLMFSTNSHIHYCEPANAYAYTPETIVKTFKRRDGTPFVAWGRSCVCMLDPKNAKKHRMLRFRFAIGFAKQILPGRSRISTANLVSSLAEFSIVYNPAKETWHFSR